MGACGSKDIAKQDASGPRDLSRWRATDGEAPAPATHDQHQPNGDDDAAAPGDDTSDTNLTLNTVVAYPYHNRHQDKLDPARTEHCVTGWEDGSVKLLNWKTKKVVTTYHPHIRAVNRIVVGATSGAIYSCSRDTTIAISAATHTQASADTTTTPVVLAAHTLNVSTISLDREESALCSGGRDTQTILWDLATAKIKAKNTTAQNVITCSKWLPSERVIAQGSEDLSVKLWDERTALRTPVQNLRGYIYFPLCLDVSVDGLYLLTSSKGFNGVGCEARVWDRRMGRQLFQLDGHQQDATACCFLPTPTERSSATTVASSTEEIVVSLGMPTPVTASKDGTIKMWDVRTRHVLSEAHEPSARTGMFTSVTHVGAGTILASTLRGKVHAFQFDALNKTLQLID